MEPVVQVIKGWILGLWPPGETQDFTTALRVMRTRLRSQVRDCRIIHERRPDAMVGVAKHALALTPCNPRRRLAPSTSWGSTPNAPPAERDEDRWTFLYLHLWQVARAVNEGIPVVGYLHGSLLDNYEWAVTRVPETGTGAPPAG